MLLTTGHNLREASFCLAGWLWPFVILVLRGCWSRQLRSPKAGSRLKPRLSRLPTLHKQGTLTPWACGALQLVQDLTISVSSLLSLSKCLGWYYFCICHRPVPRRSWAAAGSGPCRWQDTCWTFALGRQCCLASGGGAGKTSRVGREGEHGSEPGCWPWQRHLHSCSRQSQKGASTLTQKHLRWPAHGPKKSPSLS